MSEKLAGVHLRSDDYPKILDLIRGSFCEKTDSLNQAVYDILQRLYPDMKEKYAEMLLTPDSVCDNPAIIVCRRHFVSIYWQDHITFEDYAHEMNNYAKLCGVPALGVGSFDGDTFCLDVVRDAGKPTRESISSAFLEPSEEMEPVEAEDICRIIDAPFLLDGMKKVIDHGKTIGGFNMEEVFERETGLQVMMFDDECVAAGMKELYQWDNAIVYADGSV